MSYDLLFDLDGTLIDSSSGILATFSAVLHKHGLTPIAPLDRRLIGPPLRQTVEKLTGISDAATLDSLVETFKSIYDAEGFRDTRVFPGIQAALKNLRDSGVRLTIVTNKRAVPTRRIVDLLGWQHVFDAVHSLDAFVGAASNKTELVRLVLEARETNVSRAAMIGDTMEDMTAALENKLLFLGASWGYGGLAFRDQPGSARMLAAPADIGLILNTD